MALAVERAAVVLICMSDKYKASPSCRTGLYHSLFYFYFFFFFVDGHPTSARRRN
jgi:hypothetical protein